MTVQHGGRPGRRGGGGAGVVVLGRSPYLRWSDGWGMRNKGPDMVQLQQSDGMCLKDADREERVIRPEGK